jgi:hypothetical protein
MAYVIVLFNLKTTTDVAAYESWADWAEQNGIGGAGAHADLTDIVADAPTVADHDGRHWTNSTVCWKKDYIKLALRRLPDLHKLWKNLFEIISM